MSYPGRDAAVLYILERKVHPGRARSFSYIVYSGDKGVPWNVTLMAFIVGESGINFWCP